jgi:hypothetical protein
VGRGVGVGVGRGVGVGVAVGAGVEVAMGAGVALAEGVAVGVGVGPAAPGGSVAGVSDDVGDWVLPGAETPFTPPLAGATDGPDGAPVDPGLDPGSIEDSALVEVGEAAPDGSATLPSRTPTPLEAVGIDRAAGRTAVPMTIAPINDGISARRTKMVDRKGTMGVLP